jgi:hypothetical protein
MAIYSIPRKSGRTKKAKSKRGKSGSLKHIDDPIFYHQDFLAAPMDGEPQMFERNPSFREGMKGESESRLPIHTLDPAAHPHTHYRTHLSSAANHPGHTTYTTTTTTQPLSRSTPNLRDADGYDVTDHVISFRSYPAPEMSRRERVVYLYPRHSNRYQRLAHHHSNHELHTTSSGHSSDHGSRSSLVKH